jgi:hypothetical protein
MPLPFLGRTIVHKPPLFTLVYFRDSTEYSLCLLFLEVGLQGVFAILWCTSHFPGLSVNHEYITVIQVRERG